MAAKLDDNEEGLNCGLCSKLLNTPKSLPCLHMFCSPCLEQSVSSVANGIKETGSGEYRCPKCALKFEGPESNSDRDYVKNLSTNTAIEVLTKWKRLQQDGAVCGPCQKAGKNQTANIWCGECNEGLCVDCYAFHQRSNVSMFHNAQTMEDIRKRQKPTAVDYFCRKHKQKSLDHFCEDHIQPCWQLCVTSQHRKCDSVYTLEDAAGNVKESDFFKLIQRMKGDVAEIHLNIEDRDKMLKQLETERRKIKMRIRSLRQDINNHLDKMEQTFEKEMDALHNDQQTLIQSQKEAFSSIREILNNSERLISVLLKSSSDTTLFLEKINLDQIIQKQEAIMAELSSEPHRVEYEIDLAPELAELTSSVQSFGVLVVKRVQITQMQGSVEDVESLKVSKPQPIATFTTNKYNTSLEHGAEMLADGKVLLTSGQSSSLSQFDSTGRLQNQVKVQGRLLDVSMINDTQAVVTYRGTKQEKISRKLYQEYWVKRVCLANINTFSIDDIFEASKDGSYNSACGITSYGGRLFVVCKDRVVTMDTNGNIIKEIETIRPHEENRFITAPTEKTLCYTNPQDGSVTCIDMDGTVNFTYRHEKLVNPRGITSDSKGAIYVAGYGSNNVHRISGDGNRGNVLLSKDDGITNPSAIHFDRRNNKLVLTHSGSKVSIYQM